MCKDSLKCLFVARAYITPESIITLVLIRHIFSIEFYQETVLLLVGLLSKSETSKDKNVKKINENVDIMSPF
jgi:hypothetical protein